MWTAVLDGLDRVSVPNHDHFARTAAAAPPRRVGTVRFGLFLRLAPLHRAHPPQLVLDSTRVDTRAEHDLDAQIRSFRAG